MKLAEMEKRKKKKADGLGPAEHSLSSFILDSSGSSQSMIDGSVDNVNLKINEEMSEVNRSEARLEGSRKLSARSYEAKDARDKEFSDDGQAASTGRRNADNTKRRREIREVDPYKVISERQASQRLQTSQDKVASQIIEGQSQSSAKISQSSSSLMDRIKEKSKQRKKDAAAQRQKSSPRERVVDDESQATDPDAPVETSSASEQSESIEGSRRASRVEQGGRSRQKDLSELSMQFEEPNEKETEGRHAKSSSKQSIRTKSGRDKQSASQRSRSSQRSQRSASDSSGKSSLQSFLDESDEEEQEEPSDSQKPAKRATASRQESKSNDSESEESDQLDAIQERMHEAQRQQSAKEADDLRGGRDPLRDNVNQKDVTFLAKQLEDYEKLFEHVHTKVKLDLARTKQRQKEQEGSEFRSMQQSILQMNKLCMNHDEERNVSVQQVQYFIKFPKDDSSPIAFFLVMIRQ